MSPLTLAHDALGRLVLTLPGGESFVDVLPVRCFPFTDPNTLVSFVSKQGKEVYLLRSTDELSKDAREALEKELARREFVPIIRRIRSISPGSDPTDWHVETDRGETRFTLTSEDHVRRLGRHGAVIEDSHGVRYRVLDMRAMDSHSRKILAQYL